MATKYIPDIQVPVTVPGEPRTQTKPQRSGGWFTRARRLVKLAMEGDDDDLLVVNTTTIAWFVDHNFHRLGIIDPGEKLIFRLQKRGKLSVRPGLESNAVEYLILDLDAQIERVEIYLRRMGQELEVYEMRAA